VNDNLVELLVMLDALSRASASRITAVMPILRIARKIVGPPASSISSKLWGLITSAGADRVLALELHAGQIQGFFDIPVDHLYATPVTVAYFRRLKLKNLVVSRLIRGRGTCPGIRQAHEHSMAIIDKRREDAHTVEVFKSSAKSKAKRVCLSMT